MKNQNFLMSIEHEEIFENLTDEQAGRLIKQIFHYAKSGAVPDADLKLAFIPIRQYIDKCKLKYEDICEKRRSSAKKRWENSNNEDRQEPPKPENPPSLHYDITCNPNIDKCFNIYKEYCKNLKPIRYERRNRETLELVAKFLDETQSDFNYFKEVCIKANEQKVICDNALDFKGVIKNHISIYNEKFKKAEKGKVVSKLKFK